ncbi:MAG TPA: thioesterase domain-containing protein [Candidatus Angelobacter sp.]|nr:thioesterase domain-containing protein [Candidatus Angelobacter sp.]
MPSKDISGSWWVVLRPNRDAKLRLFCFPYAGGNASLFRAWSAAMPEFVEVCALQPPGRANRIAEEPIPTVTAFMAQLGPALKALNDKPFVFFGHSMGSILAFEACRWLRREGLNLPQHLFVSARRAPHIPDADPHIHATSDEEFLAEVARLKGTPQAVLEDRALLRLLIPVLRADFTLCETYQCSEEGPFSFPITVLGGVEDEETQAGRLEAWQRHTTAKFSTHEIPGDHFFIHSQEQLLLSLMRRQLAEIAYRSASLRKPTPQPLREVTTF